MVVRFPSICSVLLIFALTLAACVPISGGPSAQRGRIIAISAPLLAAHNRERAGFGSPPLAWDSALALAATAHANRLAGEGRLRHSPKLHRPGQGENLWIGTRGAFPVAAMIGSWTNERRYFRRGVFPGTSRTGRWADVGHFTAIVWPSTTRVGCGLGKSARWDVLVCRYAPSGNVGGVPLG